MLCSVFFKSCYFQIIYAILAERPILYEVLDDLVPFLSVSFQVLAYLIYSTCMNYYFFNKICSLFFALTLY